MAKKAKTDVETFLEDVLHAEKVSPIYRNEFSKNSYLIVLNGCAPLYDVRVVPKNTVYDTIVSMLEEAYNRGKNDGAILGEMGLQKKLRELLGLSETRTDGHSRTVVIENEY